MLGKIEILAVILILVLLFYFVISLGAGAFSKKETNSRTKKYFLMLFSKTKLIIVQITSVYTSNFVYQIKCRRNVIFNLHGSILSVGKQI